MARSLTVGYLLVLLAIACGDDGDPQDPQPAADGGMAAYTGDAAPPNTEQARFLNDYAAAVCAMYEPCCKREGLGYDGAGCTTWFSKVTAAYFKGSFQQSAADSCLANLADVRAA